MNYKDNFQIIPFGQDRFAIADKEGKTLDDAQGYGYKSRQKAFFALHWKYMGGKEKRSQQRGRFING